MQANALLVCFATKTEANPLRRLLIGRTGRRVLLTGIGEANARAALTRYLEAEQPALVLSCGFAGGLDPALAFGQVVFNADEQCALTPALRAAGAASASFCCVARVLTTAAAKQVIRQTTRADAVEMESAVIRACCQARGIPSATVRVISDTATEDLPLDFNRFLDQERRMRHASLLLELLKSPRHINSLLRFHRRMRLAAERLAQTLGRILA